MIALLVFAAWTTVVRLGISDGSRHTVWAASAFGTWPDTLGALDGSNNMELSIRATYESGDTLGSSTTGRQSDYGDSSNINGSRFVTGSEAGRIRSMSAFVPSPIDAPPFNQFELAIYADDHGAPGSLIAHSARGSLSPNGWNTVPLDTVLSPRTAYWLFYNSNGRADDVNNLACAPVVGEPLDSVIRAPGSSAAKHLASALQMIASPAACTLLVLALSLWVGRDSPRLAVWMWIGLAASAVLEYGLKQTLFFPYASYPSGHAMRALFVATLAVAVSRSRAVRVVVPVLAVLVSLSAVHPNRHYSEEALGGAVAGWGLASLVLARGGDVVRHQPASPLGDPFVADGFVRRAGPDRRRRERRTRPDTVEVG